jgi:ketosteroid isomerase-like protein
LVAGSASAQPASGDGAIKAANQAFYVALSARDVKAMEAVWANKPYVVNIGPRDTTVRVGYADAVSNYWPKTFALISRMSVTLTSIAQLRTDGKLAWVVGTENAVIQLKNGGAPVKFRTFFTNVFEKEGARWLMVSHHAQPIP